MENLAAIATAVRVFLFLRVAHGDE